jgi:hypothetical protein
MMDIFLDKVYLTFFNIKKYEFYLKDKPKLNMNSKNIRKFIENDF